MGFKLWVSIDFSIVHGCNTDRHPSVLFIIYFRPVFIIKNFALVSKNQITVFWYICSLCISRNNKKNHLASVSTQVRTNPTWLRWNTEVRMLPLPTSIALTRRKERLNYPLMVFLCYSEYCKRLQIKQTFHLGFLMTCLKKSTCVKINPPTTGLRAWQFCGAWRAEAKLPDWPGLHLASCLKPGQPLLVGCVEALVFFF